MFTYMFSGQVGQCPNLCHQLPVALLRAGDTDLGIDKVEFCAIEYKGEVEMD